jgi:hypothetical protein
MTESEWLANPDVDELLDYLGDRIGERKLRLFAVACCRRLWPILDEDARRVVVAAESFADCLEDAGARQELESACTDMRFRGYDPGKEAVLYAAGWSTFHARLEDIHGRIRDLMPTAQTAAFYATHYQVLSDALESGMERQAVFDHTNAKARQTSDEEMRAQLLIWHDTLGNPFHPATVDPIWFQHDNAAVPRLAQECYDQHVTDNLNPLAEALESAGCRDASILTHCRAPGNHYRGCWVLDDLLGKS